MDKLLRVCLLAVFFACCPGINAMGQPEPTKLIEVFPKPGVDFKQFKSMGEKPSVSIQPAVSWSIDTTDPFLVSRIQESLQKSMKSQGFVLMDAVDADLRLNLKVTQWGRLKSNQDLNLMEYLDFEAKVYAVASGEMIMRATGKYSRIDPLEHTRDIMHESFESMMNEILSALRGKKNKANGNGQDQTPRS